MGALPCPKFSLQLFKDLRCLVSKSGHIDIKSKKNLLFEITPYPVQHFFMHKVPAICCKIMTIQNKSNINLPLEEHTVRHFVCKKYGYTKWRTMVCDTQKHTILMDINYVNANIAQSAQSKGNVPPPLR